MQTRDEVCARSRHACGHRARRAEQGRVDLRVPQRVRHEDDVCCRQQQHGRVCAPGVRDDTAVRSGVVARYVRAECADRQGVGKVACDDVCVWVGFGDEDAR